MYLSIEDSDNQNRFLRTVTHHHFKLVPPLDFFLRKHGFTQEKNAGENMLKNSKRRGRVKGDESKQTQPQVGT